MKYEHIVVFMFRSLECYMDNCIANYLAEANENDNAENLYSMCV